MIDIISPLIKQFMPFAQERMGFTEPPRLFLRGDNKNAQNPLGKTAYYDPNEKSITIYITGRHPKDVMRSISHELVHHAQNCRGAFDGHSDTGPGYAQNDEHMREMEREAYEVGNMCFRDWEDGLKNTIYLEHLQKGDKKMSTKDWKNKEIKSLLSEAWGFKMDLSKLSENQKEYDLDENAGERVFAPNHYCAHHVKFEGREAYTVDHNWDETLQEVTEYDLKFEDGTIQRNVPATQLEVLEASELSEGDAESHLRDHPPVKRNKKVKKMKEEDDVELNEEEEEIEEIYMRSSSGAHTSGEPDEGYWSKDSGDYKPKTPEEEKKEEEEQEAARQRARMKQRIAKRGGTTLEEEELEEAEDVTGDGKYTQKDKLVNLGVIDADGNKVDKKKKKDDKKKKKVDEARMREIIAYALKSNKG